MAGWENYQDVLAQLQSAGMILDREVIIHADASASSWQTWRVQGEDNERRGRSILKEWHARTGKTYIVGTCGVWHGASFDEIKIELPDLKTDDGKKDAAELAAAAAARKAIIKQAEEARKSAGKNAARWASAVWSRCEPAPASQAYLARKKIQPHNARIVALTDDLELPGIDDDNRRNLIRNAGALVIPLHDPHGSIMGLQIITDTGKYVWPRGCQIGSTFGVLGPFPRSGILLLTEGFATAASLREATGYPVAYGISANNLIKACQQIRKAAPKLRILVAADDDYLTVGNPGVTAAQRCASEVALCDWLKPDFTDDLGQDIRNGRKLTDFNDLAVLTGLPLTLAAQVNARLDGLGWRDVGAGAIPQGGGDAAGFMPSRIPIEDAVRRFWGTYGLGGKVFFDEVERRLVHKEDLMNLLPPRSWDLLKEHPQWRVARDTEIGFDPTERDTAVRCNLFGGWPTVPKAGKCDALLGLLEYLCSNETNSDEVYQWILRWLAYPIQHRGAKMHTALVIHGPQGTGKSRFFEAYGKIFGPYYRMLGQEALEDKFNADWAEKKLFILADEVLARQDMFHIKNRLKGFITGDTIRVNPKNVAAHNERNHMNIVFLSNERMPLVIEADDRRHLVVWVPPKLSERYFEDLSEEIDNGGIEALHDYLLNLDLGDFKPWSKPPHTKAKSDLRLLGESSEQRFLEEWLGLELEGPDGAIIPLCPCLGSHLYRVYEAWCDRNGERRRGMKELISCAGKRHGWSAGESRATWADINDRTVKKRKMLIPSSADLAAAQALAPDDRLHKRLVYPKPDAMSLSDWLTESYFLFAQAAGIEP